MRILLFTGAGNCQGRAYCLWLIARYLGWGLVPVAPPRTDLWPPLSGTEFASSFITLDLLTDEVAHAADAFIAYQPLPETFAVARHIARRVGGKPIVVDIDEPHWEQRYGYTPLGRARVAAGMLRRLRNPLPYHRLRWAVRDVPKLLSNPALEDLYDGSIVPHVREPASPSPWPDDRTLRIAFVGTVRPHKGVDLLRQAVARLAGVHLTVTADPPADARPREAWIGETSLADGRRLLDNHHAIAVFSGDTPWGRRQLPVKVIDGMMSGRLVIASDLPPITWALGDIGVLAAAGDVNALTEQIARVRDDPGGAHELGKAARRRALRCFTPEAASAAFSATLTGAIGSP